MRAPRLPLYLAVTAGLLTACQGVDPTPEAPALTPEREAYFLRRRAEDALAFRASGRLESAERQLRMALQVAPEDARSLRLMALVLEEQGRIPEADALWARADAADPPQPPIPTTPLVKPSEGLLVVLVPPDSVEDRSRPRSVGATEPEVARALETHLTRRLPGVTVARRDPESLPEARRWLTDLGPRAVLSLRVDRALCGDSQKDGPFALVRLRAALAERDMLAVPATTEQVTNVELRHRRECPTRPLLRAVEALLARPDVQRGLLEEPPEGVAWPAPVLRALFPGIGVRVAREIESGRSLLALGRIGDAERVLVRARELDPEDPHLAAYLEEAQLTLSMAREIAARRGDDPDALEPADPESLDPQLTALQRTVAETLLEQERNERNNLLAALAVLGQDEATLPSAETLAALRPHSAVEEATGAQLARIEAGGPVDARSLYAPDGGVLATYYFPSGESVPVLFEQDTDGDNRPDRWTAYDRRTRRALWEDGSGRGHPDIHMIFASDGLRVERIEIDQNADGRAERVFEYAEGSLSAEARDTDGDGVLDRFERFNAAGEVHLKEEDLDGDGEIDVRSVYEQGRLVRREVLDEALLEDLAP